LNERKESLMDPEIKKQVREILTEGGLGMKQLLFIMAAEMFKKNFPKMAFKDAHCDIVNCYGIEICHPRMDIAIDASNNYLNDSGLAINIYSDVIVYRPSGLFIYKNPGLPSKSNFREATLTEYVFLTPFVIIEVNKLYLQNPGT
jgi:hypothetical protein